MDRTVPVGAARPLDRKTFFDGVRARFGRLSPGQVDGFTRVLDEWERRGLADLRWLANMLAQSWHETGSRMQPIREGGSEAYLRAKRYYPWVGEGLIQVTWEENARKFGATKPGDLLNWPCALRALFDGMIGGLFTGRKLADYFNASRDDPLNARRIVNGTDRASLIAGYHRKFLEALRLAAAAPHPETSPMSTNTTSPVPVSIPLKSPAKSTSFWAHGITFAVGAVSLFSPLLGRLLGVIPADQAADLVAQLIGGTVTATGAAGMIGSWFRALPISQAGLDRLLTQLKVDAKPIDEAVDLGGKAMAGQVGPFDLFSFFSTANKLRQEAPEFAAAFGAVLTGKVDLSVLLDPPTDKPAPQPTHAG